MRGMPTRRRLGRVIAGVLEQGGVLRPRAAIVDGRTGGRQFDAGAIDEPGARRVHALKSGKIEDHALRIFGRRDERSAGVLQLASGDDDPSSCQRQDNAALSFLTSYGRRRGHQALRPETALISRDPAPCRADPEERPRRGGSGQQQIKYESETPTEGLRFANKASPIFVQTGAQALTIVASPPPRSFPARLGGEPKFAAPAKRRRISHLPNRRLRSSFVAGARRVKFLVAEMLPFDELPAQSGTGAKGPGTNRVRIGDAALRPIRRAKSNGNWGAGSSRIKSWWPKR